MGIFKFEKWFADVLTPERDYIIIFHTILEVFGIRTCFVEVNIALFGEGLKTHLNRRLKLLRRSGHSISTRQGIIQYEEGVGKIRLSLNGMDIKLNINPFHPSDFQDKGMKIHNKGGAYLKWKPLYLKTAVDGNIRIEGERKQLLYEKELSGSGYVDYLYSSMSPFRVPVSQLYWGRLHSQDLDLSFSYTLDVHKTVSGAQLMVQTGGETIKLNTIQVQAERWEEFEQPGILCPVSYKVEASSQGMHLVLRVDHLKPAIVSEFLKNPKELGAFKLAALRLISKEPKGIKFYSLASLEFELEGQTLILDDLLMIDEYVSFK